MRTAAIGLIIAGSAGLVLMLGGFLFLQNISTGLDCEAAGECVARPDDLSYTLAQVLRSAQSAFASGSALAVLLGLTALVVRARPIGASVSSSTRRSLRRVVLLVVVLLGLSFAGLVITSHPMMQTFWNSGVCTSTGCVYPVEAQLALLLAALAPAVFSAALLALPVIVLVGALLRPAQVESPVEARPERVAAWDGRDLAPFRRPE
ncbi:hypothetical protein GCM10017602_03690 [Herbiconiux flava]|nr:hypothetical protein GCM10017602_03690 [Herbiconiux flava]